MKSILLTGSILAALFVCAANVPAQNILVNGSFETLSGPGNSNIGQGLAGWTIGNNGGIDIVYPTGLPNTFWDPADGQVSLSLNWFGPETVSQTIATQPGTSYHLSFYMAAEIYGGIPNRTMDVRWNNGLVASPSFQYTGQGPSNMGWILFGYDLIGTGNDVLAFQSTTPDNYGPALDNISLTAVPEPGVLALAAVLGSGFRAYRRRTA